jgi:2-oxoglutarate dehydrogenase E2 component (dihydrolipoamide succinyltransferase)
MSIPIKVPSIGESISEVTLSSQFKPSGSFVNEGEEIGELETDKVNQVVYAPKSGILTWSITVGQKISITQNLGTIAPQAEGVSTPAVKKPEAPKTATPKKEPVQEKIETADRKQMSSLRQTLAKRLVEAKNTTAMLTTFNEVDMSKVIAIRDQYKEAFLKSHQVKLGFMAFFIKASAMALKAFPEVTWQIEGTDFIKPSSIDIGVAVSTDKGLMVPIVKNCQTASFAELEKNIALVAEKARARTLSLQELKGGCFSITNGGVFGSLLSTPILNLPQSAILGMHTIQKRAIVVNDAIVIRPMMYLALSYDHRVIDGKEAVQFLVMIKKILEENPEDLYLDRTF